jgi:hypothetical protein
LPGPSEGAQVDVLPIEDYVRQMRRELDEFASRIKSETVTIFGITFESYDDTLKWVSQYCHKDDWKYVMDMPALYSLVKTDGQGHKALYFQSKIPVFFWPGKANKTDHPFGELATYDK